MNWLWCLVTKLAVRVALGNVNHYDDITPHINKVNYNTDVIMILAYLFIKHPRLLSKVALASPSHS